MDCATDTMIISGSNGSVIGLANRWLIYICGLGDPREGSGAHEVVIAAADVLISP